MICNTFTRQDGRKWYVQFSDPETGKRRVLVTPVRKGEPDEALKLAKIRLILQEKFSQGHGSGSSEKENGWGWVTPWIAERYGGKRASLIKHRNQWNYLSAFFHKEHIDRPEVLERAHALAYIAWRRAQIKEKSKRGCSRNTALADLRWAGSLLREAVARHLIAGNPWEKLGFERDATGVRHEFSDREIARIREELGARPEWMKTSFEIALHTGLRFAETRIKLANIDFDRGSILIAAPKGGRVRAYSIPLPTALRGLLERLNREGGAATWSVPARGPDSMTALRWSEFFKALNWGVGYCFHGTRVTFISRGARAGIPERVMMKLVNHASTEVHRIYQRVSIQDVAPFVDLVPIPAATPSRQ